MLVKLRVEISLAFWLSQKTLRPKDLQDSMHLIYNSYNKRNLEKMSENVKVFDKIYLNLLIK